MQSLDRVTVDSLLQEQQWPAISIYMPINRTGDQQDAIRFKNLLGQVERQLVEGGIRPADARKMLEDDQALADDTGFWKHAGADGLALFRNGQTEQHHLLPLTFQEMVQVGKRFLIKPLLPIFEDRRFQVLGLNRGSIRLYKGDRFHLEEIVLPAGVPKSMEEALKYDDPEQQLQFHSKTGAQGEKRGAIYHGQGVGIDEDKSNLERFFQAVDRVLAPRFEEERLPVILGGGDELQGVYRRITKSKNLLTKGICKNIQDFAKDDLHHQSWEIAQQYFRAAERETEEHYAEKRNAGLAVDELSEVVTAAFEGRVDALFAAVDKPIWGIFNGENLEAKILESNDAPAVDLVDEAVFWTLARGGRVLTRKRENMPGDSEVCALLRF